MAQREGSIYLYLFIVAMVLFSVMTAAFFINNAEKQKITLDLDARKVQLDLASKSNRELNTKISGLHVLIAGPTYATSQDWPGDDHFLNDELKLKAEKAINTALKELSEAERKYEYLIQVYADIEGLLLKYREGRDAAMTARQVDNDSMVKTKAAADEAIAKLREEQNTALQRITELEAKVEDLDNKSKQEKAEFVREMERVKQENTDKIIQLTRGLNAKETQIGGLKKRVEELQKEVNKDKSIEDIEADGQLLNVLGAQGKGWIDLGRTNHLKKGLVFRVFQYVKGGKKAFKGRIEVIKVDETVSEARIIEEDDSLNPIAGGDYIFSPFYDAKAQPVFVFAGTALDSKDVTREYLVAKMKDYGAVVKDKVDLYTDYLVAISDYESTPEYKAARELKVTVIRERDLLEFIGR